jgi:hypothetical protein
MDYFTISVDEFGRENLDDLTHFLRDYLGDDEAAKIIENLSGSDDIFEAVEKVRDLFYADSYRAAPIDPEISWFPGIAHHEGPGMEKIAKLGIYLEKYMTGKVNQLIATNSTVKARMVKYAAKFLGCSQEDVMENCGITYWPGVWGASNDSGEHSWRDQAGRPNIHFSQVDLTKSYREWEIEQVKGSADFNRTIAEKSSGIWFNGEWLSFKASADRLMEQYEEMKKAFETNTPSRYKTWSEIWLDGYQPIQKTPPGSLVDQTV